ncbi:MAG TPA: hypothetical protein VKB79_17400 [Bryobacteraceae bacterium]|nr:hypothetical protein [Bryobacteraceae bacterium]
MFKTTYLAYRPAAVRRRAAEQPAPRTETVDEARRLCGAIAEVAIEARWSRDPQVIAIALRLIERRAPLAAKLAQTLAAAV